MKLAINRTPKQNNKGAATKGLEDSAPISDVGIKYGDVDDDDRETRDRKSDCKDGMRLPVTERERKEEEEKTVVSRECTHIKRRQGVLDTSLEWLSKTRAVHMSENRATNVRMTGKSILDAQSQPGGAVTHRKGKRHPKISDSSSPGW
jgi:hypothetical protein